MIRVNLVASFNDKIILILPHNVVAITVKFVEVRSVVTLSSSLLLSLPYVLSCKPGIEPSLSESYVLSLSLITRNDPKSVLDNIKLSSVCSPSELFSRSMSYEISPTMRKQRSSSPLPQSLPLAMAFIRSCSPLCSLLGSCFSCSDYSPLVAKFVDSWFRLLPPSLLLLEEGF